MTSSPANVDDDDDDEQVKVVREIDGAAMGNCWNASTLGDAGKASSTDKDLTQFLADGKMRMYNSQMGC